MGEHKTEMLQIFMEDIDIHLFHDVVAFVTGVLNDEDQSDLYQKNLRQMIWYEGYNNSVDSSIPDRYHLRYVGELLERFEERIGNDSRTVRAIAIAIALAKNVLNEKMFIGGQMKQFIHKIELMADGDIYLIAALSLLQGNDSESLLREMADYAFSGLQELLFAVSLFLPTNQVYDCFKEKLTTFFGAGSRSVSVYGNIELYAWFINNYYNIVKGDRRKDAKLLKVIISLPSMFVGPGTKQYEILEGNGFSELEIAYLNYEVTNSSCWRLGPDFGTIINEKIAIRFCEVFLSQESLVGEVQELLSSTLKKYKSFKTKCYGERELSKVLDSRVVVKNPETFALLFEFDNELEVLRFDPLDKKWDGLLQLLGADAYRSIFDDMIFYHKPTDILFEKWIDKYRSITGTTYLSTFDENKYRDSEFKYYVDTIDLDLICLFNEYFDSENDKSKVMLQHVYSYASKMETRKAFETMQYLFNRFGYSGLSNIFEELRHFEGSFIEWSGYRRSSHLKLEREYATKEESQLMFSWLDDAVYIRHPDKYVDFILLSISSEFIQSIYPKDELKTLLQLVAEYKPSEIRASNIDESLVFLSENEKADLFAKQEIAREKERQQAKAKAKHDIFTEAAFLEDASLRAFIAFRDKFKYDFPKQEYVPAVISHYLGVRFGTSDKILMSHDEIVNLFKLLRYLYFKKEISLDTAREYLIKSVEDTDADKEQATIN